MYSESRWSAWIDIEGFSSLYPNEEPVALRRLGSLMTALYRVGSRVFNEESDRLFIHQFGDGFICVSQGSEPDPSRAVALAIAVMRHCLCAGAITKTAISSGSFADVFGTYPEEIRNAFGNESYSRLGDGIMSIMHVMGSALTNAYSFSRKPSGGLLMLDTDRVGTTDDFITTTVRDVQCIDWIHSSPEHVMRIAKSANLLYCDPAEAEKRLLEYVKSARGSASEDWIINTLSGASMNNVII